MSGSKSWVESSWVLFVTYTSCYELTKSNIWNKIHEQCEIPRMWCVQSFWNGMAWQPTHTNTQYTSYTEPISAYVWIQFPCEPIFIDCFRFLLFQVFPLARSQTKTNLCTNCLLIVVVVVNTLTVYTHSYLPSSLSLCHLMSIILKLLYYIMRIFRRSNQTITGIWNTIFNFQNICTKYMSEHNIDCEWVSDCE